LGSLSSKSVAVQSRTAFELRESRNRKRKSTDMYGPQSLAEVYPGVAREAKGLARETQDRKAPVSEQTRGRAHKIGSACL